MCVNKIFIAAVTMIVTMVVMMTELVSKERSRRKIVKTCEVHYTTMKVIPEMLIFMMIIMMNVMMIEMWRIWNMLWHWL
jgi:ABC-type arginine transport system permease subunit